MTTEEIIEVIKAEMLKKGITRYRLAKETGFTDNQIKQWLEGNVEPSLSKIILLLNALNLKIEIKSIDK